MTAETQAGPQAPPGRTVRARRERMRRAPATEAQIIATATQMFSNLGFATVSIRDIASACDLSVPSIYYYFHGKDDLYDRCCERAFAHVTEVLGGKLPGIQDVHYQVKRFTIALCEVFLTDDDFSRLLQREILDSRSEYFGHTVIEHFADNYAALIDALVEIDDSRDARALAFALYALVFGMTTLRPLAEIGGSDPRTPESAEKLAVFVLGCLFPKSDWTTVPTAIEVPSAALRPAESPHR